MLTTYQHPVPLSRNLGTLTSWNPLGLLMDCFLLRELRRTCYYVHDYVYGYVVFCPLRFVEPSAIGVTSQHQLFCPIL